MAKVQIKSDTINPFGGLFSIFGQFDRSGLRSVIDKHLGRRGSTKAAYSHGDVFASLFGSYLCGGDAIEERLPFDKLLELQEHNSVEFLAYLDGDSLVGFTYVYHFADMSWWFYFAVAPAMRGKGLGEEILKLLVERLGHRRIVMDVEDHTQPHAPNTAQRVRRHDFYARHGFADSGVKRTYAGVTYNYMVRGGSFTTDDLAALFSGINWK